MNATVGAFFGWVIVIAYVLTILNYILKAVNKKWGKSIRKNEKLKGPWQALLSFIVKYHKLFGIITIIGILVHFYIQFSRWGFVVSGAIAAGLMILQAFLGGYGAYKKTRKGLWIKAHRTIAVLLFLAIAYHLIYVYQNYNF
ncbi:hypothetical protein ACHAL6_02520 [Proteiniclasticum sp. C24MP]|uniref:hypothetical protein n=1 Tax=Proteiniclasticum sp. C24MP TaxID=3374101 RepID=UPI0037551308